MPPKIQPRLPKGMRDFLPQTMIRREYVFNTIREVFHLFGFEQMGTPVLELRETLMGKYGEDAEKLIFNANHPGGSTDLAMRYDLTVPLARFAAQYQNDLTLPFKRYQIAPVWRAERPQKGRYREFYQCDADIVGSPSMSADAEVAALAITVFQRLGFQKFVFKINNRKLLTAIGQYAGVEGAPLAELYRSIDKYDKVGAEGVRQELKTRGLPDDVIAKMLDLIQVELPAQEKLDYIGTIMGDLPSAVEAVGELRAMFAALQRMQVPAQFYDIDLTMVRGLGYYTGPIFETTVTEPQIGSIMGGGRYDDLIGLFRGDSVPTTGLSFGIERIIDVMEELNLYPPSLGGTLTEVLVTVFEDSTRAASEALVSALRAANVRSEVFLQDNKPIGKQIGYADKKGIPVVAIIGADEIAQGVVKLKRLRDAKEIAVPLDSVSDAVRDLLAGD
jgi:histidyl-tRNA synthetase